MADRWVAFPRSYLASPSFHRLGARALRLLIALHMATRDGVVEFERAQDLPMILGIPLRGYRCQSGLDELEAAGFIKVEGGTITIDRHVTMNKRRSRPGQRRGKGGASRGPDLGGPSLSFQGDRVDGLAHACETDIPKGISKKVPAENALLVQGHSSAEEAARLVSISDALERMGQDPWKGEQS